MIFNTSIKRCLLIHCFNFIYHLIQDQVDVIDLTDNDIRILENMPKMSRVSTLLLISNSITRINMTKETCQNVPNLKNLILTNNKISNFTEIYNIANFKNLECLSMLENPIALQFEYRYYIISKIPSIKYIDFCKVKPKEREEARKWAKSKDGKAFIAQIQADAITINAMTTTVSKTSETPSYNSLPIIQATPTAAPKRRIFTDDEKRQIREAVESATTPAEMDAIEKQIKVCYICLMLHVCIRNYVLLHLSGRDLYGRWVHFNSLWVTRGRLRN